jgi:hypothetical protein
MQDLSVNELADEIRAALEEKNIFLPKTDVRRMTRHFFRYTEKIAQKKNVRLNLRARDISYIYPVFDVKTLCDELAIGSPGVITVDYLIRKNKLSRRVRRHIKRIPEHLEKDIE